MPTTPRQPGLLSFIYDVSYDSAVQEAFHANENATMAGYGLSDEVQALINKIGAEQTAGQNDAAAANAKKLLTEYLSAELVQKLLPVIW